MSFLLRLKTPHPLPRYRHKDYLLGADPNDVRAVLWAQGGVRLQGGMGAPSLPVDWAISADCAEGAVQVGCANMSGPVLCRFAQIRLSPRGFCLDFAHKVFIHTKASSGSLPRRCFAQILITSSNS